MRYSAYVPYFNNATSIRATIQSVLAQSLPPAEIIVLDDGGKGNVAAALSGLPVRIVRHDQNLGRGAARARAMVEAQHDIVVCCDATTVLTPNFAAEAVAWLTKPQVAAVCGCIDQPKGGGAIRRWRGRHLYKLGLAETSSPIVIDGTSFATAGAAVRRSAVLAVGNYDVRLRHSEDADLGRRLAEAGWDVIYEPRIAVISAVDNTLQQVLERYWRWYAGKDEAVSWSGYAKNVRYSASMAWREIRAGDPLVAAITLVCPHFCFWRSWWLKKRRKGAT